MDIFDKYLIERYRSRDHQVERGDCSRNNSSDKLSRYDRYVDTSSELTAEDKEKYKVDRLDRM